MKKILFLLAFITLSVIATAQLDTTKMSNYEKYYYTNTGELNKKDNQKPEYDDLYYTPSKDQLKLKAKEIRLEQKELRIKQNAEYFDAKQEVYEDLYYASLINRFYRSYSFSYYSPYWRFSYGWYDPFFYDPFYYSFSYYYSWSYPSYYYYDPFYYNNYWYGYRYWSWEWDWRYRPRYYTYNNYYNNYYGSGIKTNTSRNDIAYGRRERQSTMSTNVIQRELRPTTPQTYNRTPVSKATTEVRRSQDRPTYNQNQRTYAPSYTQPRSSTRPIYNNSSPQKSRISNEQRYNYILPSERNVSTPSRTNTQTRSTYSIPRTPSNYSNSGVRRSTTNNYSSPSVRSSSSYNGSSSSSSRSSRSSSSSSSSSSSGSSHSGSSSGRR